MQQPSPVRIEKFTSNRNAGGDDDQQEILLYEMLKLSNSDIEYFIIVIYDC